VFEGRGFVHLRLGHDAEAGADMARARVLDPGRDYPLFYMHSLGHAEEATPGLRALVERAPSAWQAQVARFLLGELEAEELLAKAASWESPDPKIRTKWRCEAHFYVALHLRAAGETEQALEHLRACEATKVAAYNEWIVARSLLARSR
jgi:lipoprotein NlpI